MDLSEFDVVAAAEKGAKLTLLHPVTNVPLLQDDGKSEITITCVGTDSKVFEGRRRALANKRMDQRQRVRLTAEEIEEEAIQSLACCVTAWDGIVYSGEKLKCEKDNVTMILKKFPWIREQVDAFVADRGNFLKAS